MKVLRKTILGALLGVGLAVGAAAPAMADRSEAIRTSAARAFSGIALAVDAQSDFGAARARSDRDGARQAAAAMLIGLAQAKFWLAVLDADVDGSAYSEEVDADVRELNEIVGGAFDRVDDLLYAGDMNGLEAALDDSADAFTGLRRSMLGLLDALFPDRG
jgi:hypothetical protein